MRRIQEFKPEEWELILLSGAEPLPLVLDLDGWADEIRPDISQPLSSALRNVVFKVLEGQELAPERVKQWFSLAKYLDASARETLFKDIRDRAVSTVQPGILRLLEGADSSLFELGQFKALADQAVRNIVNPTLDDKKHGVPWLVSNAALLVPLIEECDDTTRNNLAAKLDEISRSDDEACRSAVAKLRVAWNMGAAKTESDTIKSDELTAAGKDKSPKTQK